MSGDVSLRMMFEGTWRGIRAWSVRCLSIQEIVYPAQSAHPLSRCVRTCLRAKGIPRSSGWMNLAHQNVLTTWAC